MQDIIFSKPSKPSIELLYNGKNCTSDFSEYLNSLTFREFEDNESDELSLVLNNHDGYFTDLWYPEKGDKLTCYIIYEDEYFSCGSFTIDENSFIFSLSGDKVEIKALTTPKTKPVRTKKVKNYTGYNLVQIAQEIGKQQGFKVVGNEGFIKVGNIVQNNESDLAFLKRVSKEYGYIFNIKDGLLTFTNKSELWTNDSMFPLGRVDIKNLNLTDSFTNVYGKVKVQYLDLKTKKLMTYTAVGNKEVSDERTIYKRCNSLEEAKVIAEAALKEGSHEVSGRIELKTPVKNFLPGVNFDLFDVGKFEGKYHITSTERKVNSQGYIITGEITKC